MVIGASLQLFPHFGCVQKFGHSNQFKRSDLKSRCHLPSTLLSSCTLRQDAWSREFSTKIYKPLYVPYRQNTFRCRSSSPPSVGQGVPLLRDATLILNGSCNNLLGSDFTMQLVPAFGVIAFGIWGLVPLMRYLRSLLHNDNNWKKSKIYYISTSYLQPLLLWIGATLICGVLDPINLPIAASQAVKQRVLTFVRSLSAVLAFACCLSNLIQQTQKFFVETSSADDTRKMGFQFAGKAIYTAVWVAAVSLFMELLGFSTQKWLTAGGLGTVLLTLAGREIFTNFLSSVMIHATRPFILNEWIQTKIEGYEVSGTVEHVGWWSPTIIRGDDREAVHIPNHKFTVTVVRNLTQRTHWRIKTHLAISHLDANKISNIVADMRKVLAKNPQIEQQRLHRRVFLENVDPENQALLHTTTRLVPLPSSSPRRFIEQAQRGSMTMAMTMAVSSPTAVSVSGGANSKRYALHHEKLKSIGNGYNSQFLIHQNSKHLRSRRNLSVHAEYSDGSRGGGGDFVAGFLLGGALFGTLAYVFAPQIRRSLLNEDEYGFRKAKRPMYYDEGLEKTRQTLNAKISQLNSAIDNVSSRLRGGNNALTEPSEADSEIEAAM